MARTIVSHSAASILGNLHFCDCVQSVDLGQPTEPAVQRVGLHGVTALDHSAPHGDNPDNRDNRDNPDSPDSADNPDNPVKVVILELGLTEHSSDLVYPGINMLGITLLTRIALITLMLTHDITLCAGL